MKDVILLRRRALVLAPSPGVLAGLCAPAPLRHGARALRTPVARRGGAPLRRRRKRRVGLAAGGALGEANAGWYRSRPRGSIRRRRKLSAWGSFYYTSPTDFKKK